MLNYVGPNIGSQPVAAMLPPATPGTMPSGVPGAMPSPAPLPPAPPIHKPAIQNHGTPHHAAIAAILKRAAPGGDLPGALPAAPLPDYGTTTQSDGSVLLHLKTPDGKLGPVVKVIPPIKTGQPKSA